MPAGGAPLEENLGTTSLHFRHYPADGVHSFPRQYCVEEPPPPIEPTAKRVKTIPFNYPKRSGGINNPSDDDPQDLVRALKMFYDHRYELRPDQQRRLMRMLGQDLDKPMASKPEIDWDQFVKSHDLPKSTHERFLYYPPYRGA
jgi:hypothetical protein